MQFDSEIMKLAGVNTQDFLQVPEDVWARQVSAAIGRISHLLWQRMDASICLDWSIPLRKRDGAPVVNQYGEPTKVWNIFNGQYYKINQEILVISQTDRALAAQLQTAVITYEKVVKKMAAKAKDTGKTPFDILDAVGSFRQQKGFWNSPQEQTETPAP